MAYTVLSHFWWFFSSFFFLWFCFLINHRIFLTWLVGCPAFQGILPLAHHSESISRQRRPSVLNAAWECFPASSGFFLCSHFFLGHFLVQEYRTLDLSANEHASSLPNAREFPWALKCSKRLTMSFMFVCPLCPKLSVGLHWRRSGVGSLPLRSTLLPRKCDLTFYSGTETSTGWRSVTAACIPHYCKAWWFWFFLCCAASRQLAYLIFVESAICSLLQKEQVAITSFNLLRPWCQEPLLMELAVAAQGWEVSDLLL